MYGLVILVGILTSRASEEYQAQNLWECTVIALDACIPDSKREAVDAELELKKELVLAEAGMGIFGILVGNTATLVVGYGVHVFLA